MAHMSTSTSPANGLPQLNRYITDHNEASEAVYCKELPEPLQWQDLPSGSRMGLAYATSTFPVKLAQREDLSAYKSHLENNTDDVGNGGTVVRIIDMVPGASAPMHRTETLDYGVVLEGEVEAVLGSGEVRVLKRGDVIVQRATNHAWRNASKTSWARMLFVMMPVKPLDIGGKDFKIKDGVGREEE